MFQRLSALTIVSASALLLSMPQAQAQEWAQYRGNAQHTGFADVSLQADASLAWSKPLNISSGVAVADGRVFASTSGYFNGQYLYALDARTGEELWKKDFGSVHSVNPPSVDNGVVYLQTGNHGSDSYFRGYNAADGSLTVKSPFSAQWERYQSPTIYEGNAYVNAGYYGGAYSYDLSTGDTRWAVGLAQYDGWTPAINDRHLVAFVGGQLVELDRNSGSVLQTITAPSFSWSGWTSTSPVLDGDVAYASASGTLTRFNLLTGGVDWSSAGVSSQIALDGDEIFAVRNGSLASLNAADGLVNWLWEDSANSNLGNSIIATQNLLIVSGGGSKTYLIDRQSRSLLQTLNVSGELALGDGQLFVSSGSSLNAFNLTAVPEPSMVLLWALGFAGLGLAARRRQT